MAEPYLSEIRMMAFGFAPEGWALCDGALLAVQQNQALFGLLGTTFGGDGVDTFALPDLRGRTPVHRGGGIALGESAGTRTHTLSPAKLPVHTHALQASSQAGDAATPGGNVLASALNQSYRAPSGTQTVPMAAAGVAPAGGGEAHPNMQPFLTVSFCISLQGSPPSPAST